MRSAVSVLGVPFNNVSASEALYGIEEMIALGGRHQVATANVDFLANAVEDPSVRRILDDCSLVLADGMPVVWASKLLGTPLRERVTGVDLVPMIADASAKRGYRLYFLGATESVMQRAIAKLKAEHPGVHISGYTCPAVAPLEEMDHEAILRDIEDAAPDILLVALGHPKQERWIHMHRNRLRVPVAIGIGGTLDLLAGELRRAPRWMQRCSLEWLYRTMQEPFRLAPRYLRDGLMLARHLPAEIFAARIAMSASTPVVRRPAVQTGVVTSPVAFSPVVKSEALAPVSGD
jgi:N-acetylglucosaminyldiphosphoundecaprenol N-acetyl-beta-D-mannosaminyltransferase